MKNLSFALLLIGLAGCQPKAGPAKPAFFSTMELVHDRYEGLVLKRLSAGGYHYARVEKASDEAERETRWIVAMGPIEGPAITVRTFGRIAAFHSKKLNKTFDSLDFTIVKSNPRKTK